MKDRFQESGPLSQRIAPLDLLAWLQSGDRKKIASVSWGSSFLLKWSFAYTLHQAWQSTTDEAKVLVLFVAGNDIAWWCIPDDLNSISPKGGDPSGFEWTRSVDFPHRSGPKWTRVDSKWTRSRMSFPISAPPKWTRSPFSIHNNKRQVSGESTWSPLRVQQRCNGSPCLQRGMLL